MTSEPLFRLHAGLPRQAPGSDACTREALARLSPLPDRPRVADLGCGPGRSALVLAETLQTRVVAIDLHAPFIDELRAHARARGLEQLIDARVGDMRAPGPEPGSLDLLWSEGAIYIIGFAEGLRLWRPLLASRGQVAVTELSWLGDARPAEAETFWREAYPDMAGIEGNVARARAAGFDVLDHFALPNSAWWDEYYTPLAERAARLRQDADADLEAVIAATEREIDLHRRFGDSYGYVFYLMRRG